jgi:glycosyltransferase involved in cell wall biosynthesis
MSTNQKQGISVIICCYNSSERLQKTLEALAMQKFIIPIPWEILLVDNASTDNTSEKATAIWTRQHTDIELRTIYEPTPGLTNARIKGIKNARYSIVVFCDDDNWLCPDYLQRAFDHLEEDRRVAACGGKGIPVFETSEPPWFSDFAEAFAVGSQQSNTENGRIFNLYGAGIAIRKQVLEQLFNAGFNPQMPGRTGKRLGSAEDMELTYAIVLMGYRLQYDDQLTFSHYLPKERLTPDYLTKLFVAFGADGPIRNLYYAHVTARPTHQRIRNWNYHFGLSIFRLLKYIISPPKRNGRKIYLHWSLSYIRELITIKSQYPVILKNIMNIKNSRAFGHYEATVSNEVLTNEYQ